MKLSSPPPTARVAKLVDAMTEDEKKSLLSVYPEYDVVYGPYKRKDERKHIVLSKKGLPKGTEGKTKTISYPKAMVELMTGEKLPPEATIDHLDGDKTNDDFRNYGIKERSFHCHEDAIRVSVSPVSCIWCSTIFTPTKNQIDNRSKTKAGPFCSRSCSGKYGKSVQSNGETLGRLELTLSYYKKTD